MITLMLILVSFLLFVIHVRMKHAEVIKQYTKIFDSVSDVHVMYIIDMNNHNYCERIYWFLVNYIKSIMFSDVHYNVIVYDIDDCTGISLCIRNAYINKKNILMFIETNGGDLISSDTIITTMRTYSEPVKDRPELTIHCVIEAHATSAGTMLALESDVIIMDTFAVMSPVDTQLEADIEIESGCMISTKTCKDALNEYESQKLDVSYEDYLHMKNSAHYYDDCVRRFKQLKQIKKLPESKRNELVEVFCTNTKSLHHTLFNVNDLTNMGFDIKQQTQKYHDILDKLKIYKNIFLYL